MPTDTHKTSAADIPERREALKRQRMALEQKRDAVYARRKLAGLFHEETFFAKILRVVLRLTGLLKKGQANAANPAVRELRLAFPGLPGSFEGYKVLHLSDLHFSAQQDLSQSAYNALDAITADIGVITGDFLWGKSGPCAPVFRHTEELVKHLHVRDGLYAVLGNHDRLLFVASLERLGIRVLVNDSVPLRRDEDTIWLCGIDDPSFFRTCDLDAALADVPERAFTILLAHSPDTAKDAARRGVNLYLCGHTHAGQICFPGIGALHYNCHAPRSICRGIWQFRHMIGHTSAGLGTTELPVRYNCPPEITVLELHRTCRVRNKGGPAAQPSADPFLRFDLGRQERGQQD